MFQAIRQLHSSPILVRSCLKSCILGFNINVNQELPDIQDGFTKGDQIANIHWILEKAREFQKNFYLCFIDYAKAFDCVGHNKLWKALKEMRIPDHLSCLLGNLYAGQEATVRTGHGTMDWFQIGKGVCQSCILSPCLFNLYSPWTSSKRRGWMKHKLELRLPTEMSISQNADDTILNTASED